MDNENVLRSLYFYTVNKTFQILLKGSLPARDLSWCNLSVSCSTAELQHSWWQLSFQILQEVFCNKLLSVHLQNSYIRFNHHVLQAWAALMWGCLHSALGMKKLKGTHTDRRKNKSLLCLSRSSLVSSSFFFLLPAIKQGFRCWVVLQSKPETAVSLVLDNKRKANTHQHSAQQRINFSSES